MVAWSLKISALGVGPIKGCFGEELDSNRSKLANRKLANGWRGTYFGFRYDMKARKETNYFPRSYMHSFICESCMAQQKHKDWDSRLTYKNFARSAPHRLTLISAMGKFGF